jgi:signal recognition particle receptor subunit beta
VYEKTGEKQKGKMISLATETDRTLFFDFLPLELGTVRGFRTRFHLYTVPGQVFYDASRKLILRGVDGVVFVADSQEERMDANLEALDNLADNLKEHGYDFTKIPYVLQLNKRDLPNALPTDQLRRELVRKGEPVFEAIARDGNGVFETLKEVARQVFLELKNG